MGINPALHHPEALWFSENQIYREDWEQAGGQVVQRTRALVNRSASQHGPTRAWHASHVRRVPGRCALHLWQYFLFLPFRTSSAFEHGQLDQPPLRLIHSLHLWNEHVGQVYP